jgi:hypothetical protein
LTETPLPRLRTVDVRPFMRNGQPHLLLRDPLQLTDKAVTIPKQLGPLLVLCDGTRDSSGLCASLAVRFGLRIGLDVMDQLLAACDEALLLDNERFAQAREHVLAEYRQAPCRPPALVGKSYPGGADELTRFLRGYLDAVDDVPSSSDGVRGLISPHIDYMRGGPVYAQVWKQAQTAVKAADLVVLLGTDHMGGDGTVTLTRQSYSTPFGILPTSGEVVDALVGALGAEAAFADELHHRSEHSIELAAVWLHYMRGGEPCDVVPILCGSFGHFVQGEVETGPENNSEISALVDALRQAMEASRWTLWGAAGCRWPTTRSSSAYAWATPRDSLRPSSGTAIGATCVDCRPFT